MILLFDPETFDPRRPECKSPYGAVLTGGTVSFFVRPPRREGFTAGVLTAFYEDSGLTEEVPLEWVSTGLGRDCFSAELPAGEKAGLVFYSFSLSDSLGRTEASKRWQLSVYSPDSSPAWFGEGMSYQIFPDRFCRLSVPDPAGMPGGRRVHRGWEEEPEYRPDARGEIRNRDFFGGSLPGILGKLPYLARLGVETLYLCPVFEGAENHRYGTGDYEKIDPMLGTEEDFRALCAEAHRLGMHILLDGVFNHVGYVSRYFNGDGSYPVCGACQSKDSPYYPWFTFSRYPDRYEAWWGIYTLPAVRESEESYLNYIIRDKNSIVRRWLRAGGDGWRLDVADELPDEFIAALRRAVTEEKPDALLLGEVWEDGSCKVAYGKRRKHILGGHCQGLMNYPFRTALLRYLLGGDAEDFRDSLETLREHYPPFAWNSAMNFLGTHDTPRALTLLGLGHDGAGESRDWRAAFRLSPEQRERGKRRLMLADLILFFFPGSPTVYYGDEAGMEGFEDPFNRRAFPWGSEDRELTDFVASLGSLRRSRPALRRGTLSYPAADGPLLALRRETEGERLLLCVNRAEYQVTFDLPEACSLLLGEGTVRDGVLTLPPLSGCILEPERPGASAPTP